MSANKLAKLRAMPPREIAHRLAYSVFTIGERIQHGRGAYSRRDRLRAALRPGLRRTAAWESELLERTPARRFFPWQNEPGFRTLFQSAYAKELEKARAMALPVLAHEISFFGQTFRMGPSIDWHADPVSGARWPVRYHRDVDGSRRGGCGDSKYVWELNRHQFLIDLAKVALLDNSQPHADELIAQLESWQAAAPYGTGAPWSCALEPAFRAWSWLWAYHMLVEAGLLPAEAHLRWLAGFYDHGRFLHRHLEYYTSPYNHLIGEASALFAMGLAFPEFEESGAWIARGRGVLEGTVDVQFHPDGGSVEQSTFYHHATLGFYLLSGILGRRHGVTLAPAVWQAIERALEFSVALVQPDGRLPSIGGADDGKPLRIEHLPLWDFRPYYAIGAVLFNRADLKAAAGRFWEDALWVLGSSGAEAFAALPQALPACVSSLPSSGYCVFRSARTEDADYLLFDCGPQAAGLRRDGVPSAAHGHADCLSVIATLGGERVLVDPGFFCYNGDPEWEVHFRRTAAHNTVAIDERDQARHVSKMAWTHTYAAHLEGASAEGAVGWARGSHDGYAADAPGVTHRRSVWLRDGGYIVMLDEFSGATQASVARANFQFAPGRLERVGPDRVLFAGRFELAWTSGLPVAAMLVEGGNDPAGGWIAPSLGVRVRAPRLVLEFPLESMPALVLTVLADRSRCRSAESQRVSFPVAAVPALLAADIHGPGWTDRLVASTSGRATTYAGIATDAALAIVRTAGDSSVDVHHIRGTYARAEDTELAPAADAGARSRTMERR